MENQIDFYLRIWHFLTTQVDWATWITLGAVLVALYPIIRDYRRTKAQARNLRIRIGTVLLKISPSFKSSILPEGHSNVTHEAVLSKEGFQETVSDLGVLLEQGSILEADELEHLGVTYMNLVLSSQIYKTAKLSIDTATHILQLADKAISLMGRHGLITRKIEKPWKKKGG